MGSTVDVVVVGAGLSGLLVARELHQAGLTVAVFDEREPGKAASWAGGGILSPLQPWRAPEAIQQLVMWSQSRYEVLIAELRERTGIDAQYTRSGLLILDQCVTPQIMSWARRFAVVVEAVDAAAAAALLHRDSCDGPEGVLFPQVGQLRNPRLLRALLSDLSQRGVTVAAHTPVVELVVGKGRISGVRTSVGEVGAGVVVVTAGAWSGELLRPLGIKVPVFPVRGQMLLIRAEPGLVQPVVLRGSRYLVPRRDGHVLVGSTVERTGFDGSVTEAARRLLAQFACETVPSLGRYPIVKHWAGLRPGSPQGIPMIGAHPQVRGLYLNTGHFRNGVVMAPAAARLTADLILERPPIVAAQPYALQGR